MMMNALRKTIHRIPSVYYPLKKIQRAVGPGFTQANFRNQAMACIEDFELVPTPVKKDKGAAALIEITNACNLNCKMCNTKSTTRPVGLMRPDLFEKILLELKSEGIQSIALHTVGETFVYKKLDVLLEIARRLEFEVKLSTNAHFPKQIEELYTRFPQVANHFRFSIDGATKETFENIRVDGNFDTVMESLEVIHRINRGQPNSRIFLAIDAVVCMTNFHEIPLFMETFGKYTWKEYIGFNLINGLSPKDEFFRETFPFANLIRHSAPCKQPFESLHFTFDGQGTMCCRDYNGDLTVGNIKDNSYKELWNSPKAEAIRAQHQNPETLDNAACNHCYVPYEVVSKLGSLYINFLNAGGITDGAVFKDRVVSFLGAMDEMLGNKNMEGFKTAVKHHFDRPL